jgi:hypothetical protein
MTKRGPPIRLPAGVSREDLNRAVQDVKEKFGESCPLDLADHELSVRWSFVWNLIKNDRPSAEARYQLLRRLGFGRPVESGTRRRKWFGRGQAAGFDRGRRVEPVFHWPVSFTGKQGVDEPLDTPIPIQTMDSKGDPEGPAGGYFGRLWAARPKLFSIIEGILELVEFALLLSLALVALLVGLPVFAFLLVLLSVVFAVWAWIHYSKDKRIEWEAKDRLDYAITWSSDKLEYAEIDPTRLPARVVVRVLPPVRPQGVEPGYRERKPTPDEQTAGAPSQEP